MQVEDVTDDGKVVTKLVRKGKDYKRPNEGATVKVAYTGRIGGPDGPIFEEHLKESPLEFVTDEGKYSSPLENVMPQAGEVAALSQRSEVRHTMPYSSAAAASKALS